MYLLKEYVELDYDLPRGFIFDIETTGLSPKYNSLAMVGYLYQEDNRWILHQELAQDEEDEKKLLLNFIRLSNNFLYTVHYNGSAFDLPFVNTRLDKLALGRGFDKRRGFDLYLHLRKKGCRGSLKLLDQEKTAGYERRDRLSGKDWVGLFKNYKQNSNTRDAKLLLLHNRDDLLGSLAILKKEEDFRKNLESRLFKNQLILEAFPGNNGLRVELYDGEVFYKDMEALSIDNLLFSPAYRDHLAPEEKRDLLLAYENKCFYENIKMELERKIK